MNPLAEPTRIAFAGDWHANTRWGVACINHVAQHGVQTIVHVGDFGYTFEPWFLEGLTKALHEQGTVLLFIDGNHEDHDWLNAQPLDETGLRPLTDRIWHVPRGFRWQWAGRTWLGCGGAHSVDRRWREPGESWWWQESITDEDVTRCVDGGPADILISHDAPDAVPVPGLDGSGWEAGEIASAEQQRALLRRIVDGVRPRLVVHGHHHRNYRAEVDFGYGRVAVQGLGMDGTEFDDNLWIVDVVELHALTA